MDVTEVVTTVLAGLGAVASVLAVVAPLTPTPKDDQALSWLQKGLTLAAGVFQPRKGIGTSPKQVQDGLDKVADGTAKVVATIEKAKRDGKLPK